MHDRQSVDANAVVCRQALHITAALLTFDTKLLSTTVLSSVLGSWPGRAYRVSGSAKSKDQCVSV